jgi:small subunit ribosomal protein S21
LLEMGRRIWPLEASFWVRVLETKGGEEQMATVNLRPGESQESLLKRFRKEVMKERILPTVRKKRWFTSPSELRRLKKQKAIRKARQAQRRREGRESMR